MCNDTSTKRILYFNHVIIVDCTSAYVQFSFGFTSYFSNLETKAFVNHFFVLQKYIL